MCVSFSVCWYRILIATVFENCNYVFTTTTIVHCTRLILTKSYRLLDSSKYWKYITEIENVGDGLIFLTFLSLLMNSVCDVIYRNSWMIEINWTNNAAQHSIIPNVFRNNNSIHRKQSLLHYSNLCCYSSQTCHKLT